jgi:hypothetical protein
MKMLRTFESGALETFSYSNKKPIDVSSLESLAEGDATSLAWLNGFDMEDARSAVKAFVERLFSKNLPPQKLRWGFKEIRYGPADGVAECLLELFPGARIIYVVREPISTVESMIYAWKRDVLHADNSAGAEKEIAEFYAAQIQRWLNYGRYYLNLREKYPQRVMISRVEYVEIETAAIAEFASLDESAVLRCAKAGRVNTNVKRASMENASLSDLLGRLCAQHANDVADLTTRFGYDVGPARLAVGP